MTNSNINSPQPIRDALRPVPSLVPAMLPDAISGIVFDGAERIGCQPDFSYFVSIGLPLLKRWEWPNMKTKRNCSGTTPPPEESVYNTVILAQQKVTINALITNHDGSITIQLREDYSVMLPAARVWELRHDVNYRVVTHWHTSENAQGHKHRNARYVLLPGQHKGGK